MRLRLSVMMALVYAVQGAFWPVLAVHLKDLGIGGRERGWIFATLAIGSFAMPLGAGQLVDRALPVQRLLSLIFAVATGFLVVLGVGHPTGAAALFVTFQVFWLVVAPAFALANTVALRHLERPHEQFAGVRLWGTIGWMAVGWLVSGVMAASGSARAGLGAYESFGVSAVLAAGLALYGLTLPDTPPLAAGGGGPSFSQTLHDARALVLRPGMGVFLMTAFGVHLTTPFVFQVMPTYLEDRGLPRAWISSALTLGQWPEVAMLAALPRLVGRLGIKGTLALGIAAWVVRFGSLAADPPLWLAVAGIPLHGVGIACFTVAGQMYADGRADRDRRASAQALHLVVTGGLGSLLGSLLAGSALGRFGGDYGLVFLVPCVIDATLLLLFCMAFRPSAGFGERTEGPRVVTPRGDEDGPRAVGLAGFVVTESADG